MIIPNNDPNVKIILIVGNFDDIEELMKFSPSVRELNLEDVVAWNLAEYKQHGYEHVHSPVPIIASQGTIDDDFIIYNIKTKCWSSETQLGVGDDSLYQHYLETEMEYSARALKMREIRKLREIKDHD